MNTPKRLSLVSNICTFFSVVAGFIAAYLWYRSAMVGEARDTIDDFARDMIRLSAASGTLNKWAAGATAIALLFQTLGQCVQWLEKRWDHETPSP